MIRLIIAYILNVVDYIFTAYWVNKFGVDVEANPIGRWMFSYNVAWAFKILIVGGLFVLLGHFVHQHPKRAWIAYIPLVVYALISILHIMVYFTIIR